MDDERDKLKDTISQLQAQLDDIRQTNPALAAHLESTVAEAQRLLAAQQPEPAQHRSVTERLSNAVLQYEASHPGLAGNLGSIIDALAQMGI